MTPPTGRGARSQQPEDIAARERLADWAKAYSDAVVDGVLYYRDKRGMKNSDLLIRLEHLGWAVTSNTLAGILGKKRTSMPATDVMLFAEALNVPPSALLFATHRANAARLFPTAARGVEPWEAVKWFSGELDLPTRDFGDDRGDTADDYYEVGDIVARAEEIATATAAFSDAHAELLVALQRGDDAAEVLENARQALEALAERRRYLRLFHPEAALPPIRPALAFVDQPKRYWPDLPLDAYSTAAELQAAQKVDAVVGRLSSDPAIGDRLEADRQRLLDEGTHGEA